MHAMGARIMRSCHFCCLLAVLVLLGAGGCRGKVRVTYSFQDAWRYLVPSKKEGKLEEFARKLEDWCAANGYTPAVEDDLPVFARETKAVKRLEGAELALVRYLTPFSKTGGVLVTLEKDLESAAVHVVFYMNREGRETETEKQKREIAKLQADFEAAFPELK